MRNSSEYPATIARFYDVIYAHLRTVDRDFFLKKILGTKGPVLEIGVGTGRFFLDAVNDVADIYGIDDSHVGRSRRIEGCTRPAQYSLPGPPVCTHRAGGDFVRKKRSLRSD